MTIQVTRILILILICFKLCHGLEIKPQTFNTRNQICTEQSKQPYFDIDIIIRKPWRIYYTWNVDMENKCLDMVVKNASVTLVKRIYNDMRDYLQTEPEWDAATIYISMGTAKHELLLFADQGAEGSFLGVPNVIKDGSITPARKAVPLLKFFMKLVYGGKFLLMMDCHIGVASLMSQERPPYRADIQNVATSLNLGDGLHACLADKRKDEISFK